MPQKNYTLSIIMGLSFLAGKYGCCHKPTQTGADISILCWQHGPIWPNLKQHLVLGGHVANMLATFVAKPPAISPHNVQHLEAIHNGREHELRVERGRLNALRILESARERTQLQILECSRMLAELEARDAAEAAV